MEKGALKPNWPQHQKDPYCCNLASHPALYGKISLGVAKYILLRLDGIMIFLELLLF